jgi:hypothetical protein
VSAEPTAEQIAAIAAAVAAEREKYLAVADELIHRARVFSELMPTDDYIGSEYVEAAIRIREVAG